MRNIKCIISRPDYSGWNRRSILCWFTEFGQTKLSNWTAEATAIPVANCQNTLVSIFSVQCTVVTPGFVHFIMPLFGRKTNNSKREGELVKNGHATIVSSTAAASAATGALHRVNDSCKLETNYSNTFVSSPFRNQDDVSVREIIMTEKEKPKLVFHCQQAQGSPTGLISGFSNVKELYEKIAECYDFTPDEVSFILQIL